MKKILMSLMCISLLSGCGNDNKANNVTDDTAPNENVTDTVEDNNNMGNNAGNTTGNNNTAQNTSWYDNFETGLKGRQINYSTKTSLDASSIGGAEGYRYATDNGNIDIYRFEDGEEFERIKREKTIDIDGKSRKVEVKDNMVIVSEGLSDDIMNIFRGR